MVFSYFRGTGSGGLIPPVASTGGGGFTVNPSRLRVNGFAVNGFIPPGDALRHGRSRKRFRICSCEKCVRNSPGICSCKTKDLNFPGISSYRKAGWGGLPPTTAVTRKRSR